MDDDLTAVDAAQLTQWAFGRQHTEGERERADAALRELARRAEAERVAAAAQEAERVAAERAAAELAAAERAAADGVVAPEHLESSRSETARRHRRRMLVAGFAGIAIAAIAASVGVAVLSQPDPDPLAVFDRAESQDDRESAQRLTAAGIPNVFTAGPRTIELGNGMVAIVARISTVPDGRSTEWDSLCLFVESDQREENTEALGGRCTHPERFERNGITLFVRPSGPGGGLDTVTWGPIGGPQVEANVPLDRSVESAVSVLDWMTYPSLSDDAYPDWRGIVTEPNRLLMGPGYIPLQSDTPAEPAINAAAYLLRGETSEAGPVVCIRATAAEVGETTACAPLSIVRRQGLTLTVVANAREWEVSIGADGPDRRDTVRAID